MLNKIKNNLRNILVDVAGAQIPLSGTSQKLNQTVPKPKLVQTFRTVADIERGKFRRLFDRHRVAYGH